MLENFKNMNVLVLGNGGREHSICSNLYKSKKIPKDFIKEIFKIERKEF